MSEQLTRNYNSDDSEPDVAIDIEDRFFAINSLADIHVKYARARGLGERINHKS